MISPTTDSDPSDPSDQRGRGRGLDPWRQLFLVELRVRDVPGATIGDALAVVDSHCAETGQGPEQAFGPADSYAAEVADSLPVDARTGTGGRWATVWPAVLSLAVLVGVTLLLSGVGGLTAGHDAELGAGALAGLAACVVLTSGLIVLWPAGLLSLARPGRRSALLVLLLSALILLPAVGATLWPATALTLPAWPCVVVGALALVASWVALSRAAPDPVVDPRDGRASVDVPRWAVLCAWILPPAVLVVSVLLLVSFPR